MYSLVVSILITFIHILQPKINLQSFDNASELKIPNKLSLTFLYQMSQSCFIEASIWDSAGS